MVLPKVLLAIAGAVGVGLCLRHLDAVPADKLSLLFIDLDFNQRTHHLCVYNSK